MSFENLESYADNEGKLYSKKNTIRKALKKRKDAGTYSSKLAVVLWEYFAEDAARLYAKEITQNPSGWAKLFPPKVRRKAAEKFARNFEQSGFEVF